MRKRSAYIKNIAITLGILCLSFAIGLLLQTIFNVQATIPTVFVFAVFSVEKLPPNLIGAKSLRNQNFLKVILRFYAVCGTFQH